MIPSDQRITIGGSDDMATVRLDFPIGAVSSEVNDVRERAKEMQHELAAMMRTIENACVSRRSETLD